MQLDQIQPFKQQKKNEHPDSVTAMLSCCLISVPSTLLISVNIHWCLETHILRTRRALCMRPGQEQHGPQAAVTTLTDQGQHQAPCAEAGQPQPNQSRMRLVSLHLSPTALFASRVWGEGSCATKAMGTTFASMFQS